MTNNQSIFVIGGTSKEQLVIGTQNPLITGEETEERIVYYKSIEIRNNLFPLVKGEFLNLAFSINSKSDEIYKNGYVFSDKETPLKVNYFENLYKSSKRNCTNPTKFQLLVENNPWDGNLYKAIAPDGYCFPDTENILEGYDSKIMKICHSLDVMLKIQCGFQEEDIYGPDIYGPDNSLWVFKELCRDFDGSCGEQSEDFDPRFLARFKRTCIRFNKGEKLYWF